MNKNTLIDVILLLIKEIPYDTMKDDETLKTLVNIENQLEQLKDK